MDEKFINLALNLAKKNLGLTSPNPSVGCVIVKNGEIIASGATAAGGRPHAENIAINNVADKTLLNGATLYVTLEPCCHFGQTSPCTDIIIAHKIKKVVIATIDTYKKVNGGGIAKLREAGIEVVCGILEKQAKEINRAFFKTQESGLPYVTLKLATSLDGKIATKNFHSKWITGEKARHFAHYLRAQNDAIMVGANTIKYDNPLLNCRISGLANYSPKRIIIANNVNFDEKLKIFQTAAQTHTIILANKEKASQHLENIKRLENLGVEIIFCEEKKSAPENSLQNEATKNSLQKENNRHSINLKCALEKIAASGINSVLVEGGQNLATQLLQENLVDELVWIHNKKIIGADGICAVGEMGFSSIDNVLQNFTRQELQELGEDDFVSIYKFNV